MFTGLVTLGEVGTTARPETSLLPDGIRPEATSTLRNEEAVIDPPNLASFAYNAETSEFSPGLSQVDSSSCEFTVLPKLSCHGVIGICNPGEGSFGPCSLFSIGLL